MLMKQTDRTQAQPPLSFQFFSLILINPSLSFSLQPFSSLAFSSELAPNFFSVYFSLSSYVFLHLVLFALSVSSLSFSFANVQLN